jgi:hypothetical protein
MDELLWTYEDVVRFIDHPTQALRVWAVEHLIRHFSDRAGDAVLEMVDDPYDYISLVATRFLGETGEREKYGPALTARLGKVSLTRLAYLARALAKLDYREAAPLILERVESEVRGRKLLTLSDYLNIASALGACEGEPARLLLWEMLDQPAISRIPVDAIMHTVLTMAQPEDIRRMVRFYRSMAYGPKGGRRLRAFASAVHAGSLTERLESVAGQGLEAMLEQAEWWLGADLQLSETVERELQITFDQDYQGVFDVLLREAQRLISQRGDDVSGWLADWQAGHRPVGYRREALIVPLILEAFAAQPAPSVELRREESVLGLALVCQLSVNRDDQELLDGASDRTETLLAILSDDREHVLPDIVEQVAALGPDIVPRLAAMMDPLDDGWSPVRILDTIELLARRRPGCCDEIAPMLIEMFHEKQGDLVLESGERALQAIGPAGVESIAEHLLDGDDARQIYLAGALREIPTERAAQGMLSLLDDSEYPDEMVRYGLARIGSPSAIEPLYRLWQIEEYQDKNLAESLFILCEVNGVDKPELPFWRRMVLEEEARIAALFRQMDSLGGDEDEIESDSRPRPSKARGISKKELKKRAAQRKNQKKEKKKHRK